MKNYVSLFIGLISMPFLVAQNIGDALRYSMDEIQGTARFRAMSGAFGALGGDLSAVSINPAGSAVFIDSHASVTTGVFSTNRDVTYFNGQNNASESNFDLNQLGAAFVFRNYNPNSPWKRFTMSIAYDRTSDFDEGWFASGVNPTNNIGDYFFEFAQGRRLDEISTLPGESISEAYQAIGSLYGFGNQQAFLGYEGFVIDPVNNTDDNTAYLNNINGINFNQQYSYASRGYNGKLAFNFATSYKDRFYLGLNLNSHFLRFEQSTFLRESNNNPTSSVTNVNFGNNLFTTGSGFSFQIGGIAKLTEELRVGLTYNSPTWYRISEETTQNLATTRIEGNSFQDIIINPNVINIFPAYRLQTPGKLTGSLAYVFGSSGLISFDYSLKDYSNTRFRPTSDSFFLNLNNQINNNLDTAISYRIGGEYRYDRLSFRAGYRFEESPYKDGNFVGDLNGYSAGLGYNFGSISLDFAFSQSQRDFNYQLYDKGLTDTAKIESTFTDFFFTLGFRI